MGERTKGVARNDKNKTMVKENAKRKGGKEVKAGGCVLYISNRG